MMPALERTMHDPSTACATPGGSRLVAADGRELPLRGTRVVAEACAGRARVKLEQRFVNAFAEPLSVTYLLPLPADGAVSGFSFVLNGERTLGRIERRAEARERFEQAVAEGKSAALLEQERSSVFHQEIGNVPPGEELIVEVLVDQPLIWLLEGDWEWRWPQVVAPRYGLQGAAEADARLDIEVYAGKLPATLQLALKIRDQVRVGEAPRSPSHTLARVNAGDEWRVSLGDRAEDTLDRDLVVRWPVAAAQPGVSLDVACMIIPDHMPSETLESERVFGLLTIVPPRTESCFAPTARDLIVLMDTSGSMAGEPLSQSKRVVCGLVQGLGPNDSLELLEFSNRVTRFEKKPVPMTEANRARALDWVMALSAGGGTEMRTGIAAALAEVRADAQRQILLVTDGQIGFEADVVANILRSLPASSRLHTLGVGEAVNRSLTGPAARAGRGSEHVLGVGEAVEPVLQRIVARLEAPLVTNLSISGAGFRRAGRASLPDLHAGAPALIPIELGREQSHLTVRGQTAAGEWSAEIEVPPVQESSEAPALALLFARERVEDLEMWRAAGKPGEALDGEIEALGLCFGIATRMTSWVAVRAQTHVDPTAPLRHVNQPQALPHGMSAQGLGLRHAGGPVAAAAVRARSFGLPAAAPLARPVGLMTFGDADDDAPVAVAGAGGVFALAEEDDGPPELIVDGRVFVTKPDRLVIMVLLGIELAWERPERVSVELEDGTQVELELDPTRSTASTSMGVGQSIRLWLKLDAPLTRAPLGLRIATRDCILRVTLAH